MANTCTCPNCDGTGKLPHYSHIANGDCFACGGTGKLDLGRQRKGGTPITMLEVFTRKGKFFYAAHRCTLIHGNTWGRCLFAADLDDADQARKIWRELKGQPNARLVMTEIPDGWGSETVVVHQSEDRLARV